MCKGLGALPTTCLKSAKDIKYKQGFLRFLIQKHDPQAAEQKQTKEKTDTSAKSIPTPAEVKQWKKSFNHVMSSKMGRKVFTNFLRSEFSEENMEFWVSCEDYKKSDPSALASRAQLLYQQHVQADAPSEVNLDAATREETRRNLENACPTCFNDAQKMIYTLMERDSYRRFLASKLIQDLCQSKTRRPEGEQQTVTLMGCSSTAGKHGHLEIYRYK